MELKCCQLDCGVLADYELRAVVKVDGAPVGIEDHTHACLAHISDLMTDAPVHEVVRLVVPGNPTPVYR